MKVQPGKNKGNWRKSKNKKSSKFLLSKCNMRKRKKDYRLNNN